MKITKKTTFAELIENHPKIAEELRKKGLGCVGCPMARMETIEQGAIMHGMTPETLLKDINKIIKDGKRIR